MKRIGFKTPLGHETFDGRAPVALGVLQLLSSSGKSGLTVPQMLDELLHRGILMPRNDERQSLSSLCQKLIKSGAVRHPCGQGNSHRYAFVCWPQISPA